MLAEFSVRTGLSSFPDFRFIKSENSLNLHFPSVKITPAGTPKLILEKEMSDVLKEKF